MTCPTSATGSFPFGAILYTYDSDGNVLTKKAPSPNQLSTGTATVTTTYRYDALNRITSESYSDTDSSNPVTPGVSYGYDGVALTGCTSTPPALTDSNPAGNRTAMCDGSGATSWVHDIMNRVLQERRTIGTVSGDYENDTFNLDGSVASVTSLGYGVSYTYSGAARPLTAAYGSSINFVTGATYAAPGELTGMTMGSATGFAGITVANAYNNRLQPILLSAASPSGTLFSECFDFHLGVAVTQPAPCSFSASTAGDNGNVYQIVNNGDNTRTQNFNYDSLNRIQQGYSSGTQWGETFAPTATSPGVAPTTPGIDAWGNLTNRSGVTGKTNYEPLSLSAGTNNQLSGLGNYDPAGNLTGVASAYVYDDENRLIATTGFSYIYDGDGERVEKCTEGTKPGTCATGATGTLYWRGAGGAPLSETDLSGKVQNTYIFFNGQRIARSDSSGAIHYYFSDHLGSHGVVENATGSACEQDIDYYPYGGQEDDYCPSIPQHYKFTGKERDAESNLDMFGARYYGSSLGRFMTPDWAAKPITVPYANFGNPQSLNLYSHVENNPMTLVDTDGHEIIYADNLKNAQVVKDSVQAILADPHTSGNLSGYVGPNNPNLVIQNGDLSAGDTRKVNPDGSVTTTTVRGNTAPDIQTTSSSSTDINGVTTTTGPETTLNGATITIDDRTSKGDVPGVMVHESVHAGEANANPAQFAKDAAAEKSNPDHDARPQEERANAAQKAYGLEIKKIVKRIEKDRKPEKE